MDQKLPPRLPPSRKKKMKKKNMYVLVICATEESIDERVVRSKPRRVMRELYRHNPDADIEYYYVNMEALDLSRENRCFAELFGTSNIKKEIERCFPQVNIFDAIVLEHCPDTLFTLQSFENFSEILKDDGVIILEASIDLRMQAVDYINLVRQYLIGYEAETILVDLKDSLDDIDGELEAYIEVNDLENITVEMLKNDKNRLLDFMLWTVVTNDLSDPFYMIRVDGEPIQNINNFNLLLQPIKLTASLENEFIYIKHML